MESTGIVGIEKNVWFLDFVCLLTVCYNKYVPVSLCGRINFLHFEILATLSRSFPLLDSNFSLT